jgi:hypothetical protein
MEVTYPNYVLERDDFSFREFTRTDDLDFCEQDDVLDGLCTHIESQTRVPTTCDILEPA